MNKTNETMYKGALVLGISTLLLKMIGLFYKIPLSYILGDEGMGYFNSAYTVYTFFFILGTAGIPKAISILVSKSEAEKKDFANVILKFSMIFFSFLGIILFLIFIFSANFISSAINNSHAVYAMYSIAPSIPFMCCCGVMRGYLLGKLRFFPVALSELIAGVSKLGFGLLFANIADKNGFELFYISAFTILGITIGAFLSFAILTVAVIGKQKRTSSPKVKFKDVIKSVLKIAVPITLSSALGGIAGIIDLTITMNGLINAGYSQVVANALYGNYTTLALPMFTLASTLITPVCTALMPTLSRCIYANDMSGFNKSMENAAEMVAFITAPCAIFFLLCPYEILQILFEEGSATLGYAYLSSLAPSILALAPLTLINTGLESDGNVTVPVLSLSSGIIIKLLVSRLLFSFDSVGIFAISIGTFFSYLIPLIISAVYFGRKEGIKMNFAYKFIPPVFRALASVVLGLGIEKYIRFFENSRINSAVLLIIMAVFYLILSLFLSKNKPINVKKYVNFNKKKQNRL